MTVLHTHRVVRLELDGDPPAVQAATSIAVLSLLADALNP